MKTRLSLFRSYGTASTLRDRPPWPLPSPCVCTGPITDLPVFKSHRVYFAAGRTLEVIDTNDDFAGGSTLLPQAVESHLHQRRSEIKPRRMPAGWTSRFITLTEDLIVDLPCPARVAIFNNGDIFHGPTTI